MNDFHHNFKESFHFVYKIWIGFCSNLQMPFKETHQTEQLRRFLRTAPIANGFFGFLDEKLFLSFCELLKTVKFIEVFERLRICLGFWKTWKINKHSGEMVKINFIFSFEVLQT